MVFNKNSWLYAESIPKFSVKKLSVGSSVYLMENEVPTEYLVVHQGLPSDLYDKSCNGTWLLRKDIYERKSWGSSGSNNYKNYDVHTRLNTTFLDLFDPSLQEVINQVKIPYCSGDGENTMWLVENGLDTKVFALGCYEVGWTTSDNVNIPVDGSCLSYFSGTSPVDSKRIANFEGETLNWGLRSPRTDSVDGMWLVAKTGALGNGYPAGLKGTRPALILSPKATFDPNTFVIRSN